MNLHNTEFIKSAAAAGDFIKDGLPKVVFAGKSNVGKSSVINKLLNRKQFARVSATPGKTANVNYFLIDKSVYFVDLPGYGYARVADSERARWRNLMETFFSCPECITLGILIVDARHPPTADDVMMAQWFKSAKRPALILANKTDKVKNSQKEKNLAVICETLNMPASVEIIPFSAVTGEGKDAVLGRIKNSAPRKNF